jgi:NAD(P)-dependent dehydrogenase (short-subunit alcohol dehydrogenase family)
MKDLQGKVAVITGAASGIGRAVAGRCVSAGMKVVLADIDPGGLDVAEKELGDDGADVLAVVTDVSKPDQVHALANRTLDAFGAVHLLHNNAGVATGGFIWQCPIADWKWLLDVNLWGVIHGVHTFVPLMLEGGADGHIVNTASAAGLTSPPLLGAYNVTKHGVVTLSETLARELAMQHSKIKVSVLCPGFVTTGVFDPGGDQPGMRYTPEPNDAEAAALASHMMEGALAPEVVADHVLDAVRHEQFYVLTHPELTAAVRTRTDDIISGRTPRLESFF